MRMRMENIKRVRLIDLTFNQPLTVIGGDFSQGKSTFLSGYEWCFGGKAVIDMDPIQHGKQSGTILCEMGDGEKVTLRVLCTLLRVGESGWTRQIELEIPGHMTPSKVQDFLDQLAGEKAFDPMSFDALKAPEQYEALRSLVGAFDFAANEAEHQKLFKERTEVNRDQKREEAAADAIVVAEAAPHERVDEEALTQELQEAGNKNLTRQQRQARRDEFAAEIVRLQQQAQDTRSKVGSEIEAVRAAAAADLSDLEQQLETLNARIAARRARIETDIDAKRATVESDAHAIELRAKALQERLSAAEALPEEIDTTVIAAKLTASRLTNKVLSDWETLRDRKKAYRAEADRLQAEANELTIQIKALEAARTKAISEAKLPVEGLGFGEGFVTLNGVPWGQAGESERVDASTAIAMALNPHLKVILIRNGSGVAKRMRKRIEERAAEKKYRVLMEVVDTPDGTHVVIEDGCVRPAATDGQAAEGAAA